MHTESVWVIYGFRVVVKGWEREETGKGSIVRCDMTNTIMMECRRRCRCRRRDHRRRIVL